MPGNKPTGVGTDPSPCEVQAADNLQVLTGLRLQAVTLPPRATSGMVDMQRILSGFGLFVPRNEQSFWLPTKCRILRCAGLEVLLDRRDRSAALASPESLATSTWIPAHRLRREGDLHSLSYRNILQESPMFSPSPAGIASCCSRTRRESVLMCVIWGPSV